MDRVIENVCVVCGGTYTHSYRQKSKYCSSKCRTINHTQKQLKGVIDVDYVVCGLCNLKFKEINADHLKTHNLTKSVYDEKYGNRTSEVTRKNKDTLSTRMTPELSKKLSNSHKLNGFISKYGECDGTYRYNEFIRKMVKSNSLQTYIENYGYDDGLVMYGKTQKKKATTLENLIKKHGVESGTEKYSQWTNKQKVKNTIGYYIELYGYDGGLTKWFDKNNKISLSNTKIPKCDKKQFTLYCQLVNKYTRISLQLNTLDNMENRGLEMGFDLDHRYSKVDGFRNGIQPEVIGHISNLEIVDSSYNRKKQHNSNIDVNVITETYLMDGEYINIIQQETT